MLTTLSNLGFYDFMLPWLLFLAVFYGLLQSKKTISEDAAVNGVIAIVAAFLTAFIARGFLYTRIFGTMGVVAAGLVILLVFLAMFGLKPEELFGEHKAALGIALALLVLFIFLSAGGLSAFGAGIDSDTVITIVILLVMVGAIAFIGGGKGGE
ncbi:Uncharacterised protein [uncultured archaeon]|nr:Uncharacterised protein [uncultured archaeon]